jgi:hypothetical protein
MDHATPHWDRMAQYIVGNTELLERMDPARREREINRPPSDNIAFARISPSLVKIDIVPTPPQIRSE